MDNEIKWIQTDDYLVVIAPGNPPRSFATGSDEAIALLKAIKAKAWKKIAGILNPTTADGFTADDSGAVSIDGVVQDSIISDLITKFKEQDLNYTPLVNLGKKISQIESDSVRNQLAGFLRSGNAPITPDGCFIAYKGVRRNPEGKLVDCASGKFDNSIGKEVSMNRSDVDPNPNVTCSRGLHVAAFNYVRQCYSGSVHIVVKVDPLDVVSVPTDYNNQKMRTCRYTVLGYMSEGSEIPDAFAPWAGSIQKSASKVAKLESVGIEKKPTEPKAEPVVKQPENQLDADSKMAVLSMQLNELTAKQIVVLVHVKTSQVITRSIKSKGPIVDIATKILREAGITSIKDERKIAAPAKVVLKVVKKAVPAKPTPPVAVKKPTLKSSVSVSDIEKMTARQIVDLVKKTAGITLTVNIKSKERVVKAAIQALGVKQKAKPAIKGSDLEKMSASAIVDFVRAETGAAITISIKSKIRIVAAAKKILGIK
jgi:hypothetical protein